MDNTHEYINISETPDKWVIIKTPEIHKVFASWAGGYLDGDRWKLNSGIEKVEEDENHYYFFGYSGSCYKCHKRGYGVMTSFANAILERIKNAHEDIEVLDDQEDWVEYFKEENK